MLTNKLGLSCAKLRLNWASMLRLLPSKFGIQKAEIVSFIGLLHSELS